MKSHVDQDESLKFVKFIKNIYSKNLSENVGAVHNYLGMTFDYLFDGKECINMCKHLSKVISEFPEEIAGVSAMPAADHQFKVRENG
jgi:hypothetical protein